MNSILQTLPMLPESLEELVLRYSGHWFYWKNIFTNDVLPELSAGWRLVGMTCDEHGDSHECNRGGDETEIYCELRPCTECYVVGIDNCDSCNRDNNCMISYDDFQYYMLNLTLGDSYPFLPDHCYRAIRRYPEPAKFIVPLSSRVFHPDMPATVFEYLQKKNLLHSFAEFRRELSSMYIRYKL